jgi:hypothetical protein
MRKTTQLVLVPVATVACIAGFAGPAAAARASSEVVITKARSDTEHVQVRGKVTSDDDKCTRNRKVSVYDDVPPAGPSSNDFKIGSTRTDDNGRWDLASVALPDKVYAVVKKNKKCKGDTSGTEVVRFHGS